MSFWEAFFAILGVACILAFLWMFLDVGLGDSSQEKHR